MVTQTVLMILEEPRKAPWNSPSISELLWETVDAVSILAVGFLAKLHILHSFSYLLNKKPGIKKSFLSPRHLSPILLWLGSLWNPDVLLCVTDQSNANPKTQRLHITVPSVSEDSESTFSFFKVWWKFIPWCWEALGSDCFCFRLRAVLYEKSVSLMCFDLLSVTRLTPTCGCLHPSDQKRSYIWMGVVEISTHSGGSQQEALNTKIFSSTQQRPLGSTHIASLPALVSSRSANNTLFFPNKSSRVQKKLGFWQKFAFVTLPVKEQRKIGSMGGYFLSGLKCWRYGFSRTCHLETGAELAPCFWCCPSCQKLNFTYSFSSLQCLLSLALTLSLSHTVCNNSWIQRNN